VLDVDSPKLARFDRDDGSGLKAAIDVLLESSDFAWLAV
jgi:putative methionine-R-sulfoxide reductase with GAF domain